jgi:hypothetical protein
VVGGIFEEREDSFALAAAEKTRRNLQMDHSTVERRKEAGRTYSDHNLEVLGFAVAQRMGLHTTEAVDLGAAPRKVELRSSAEGDS